MYIPQNIFFVIFNQTSQHDNDRAIFLDNHSPKLRNTNVLWSLRCNICAFLVVITTNKICVDILKSTGIRFFLWQSKVCCELHLKYLIKEKQSWPNENDNDIHSGTQQFLCFFWSSLFVRTRVSGFGRILRYRLCFFCSCKNRARGGSGARQGNHNQTINITIFINLIDKRPTFDDDCKFDEP